MPLIRSLRPALAGLLLTGLVLSPLFPASAAEPFDEGRLLATGGVSQVEGSGGGGLGAWALITGYGTRDGIGLTAYATEARTRSYRLQSYGAGIGMWNRLELTVARQAFDTRKVGALLGLGAGYTFHQNIVGAKFRLFGDAVFDQDVWYPQVSIGLQHKRNDRATIVRAVGAKDNSGTDIYVAASKLLLEHSLLLNGTVRFTKANQLGILGFGGDRHDRLSPEFEGSAALLLSKDFAVGVEYRTKPDNLGFAREDDWADLFVAWFPTKNISITAAALRLGSIATQRRQNGGYLSMQVAF